MSKPEDKAAQRSTLILQLGMLLAPLNEMAKRTPPPTAEEYRIAAARGILDFQRWKTEVGKFATVGGVQFAHEVNDILHWPGGLLNALSEWARINADDSSRQNDLRDRLEQYCQLTLAAIDRVPIEWAARLHEAQTPFSVYLKIRDAIGTAKRRMHYFDRYLDTEFFHLYLRDLNRGLEVRLVTTNGRASYGVTNVLSVSRVAAREFTNYRLIECQPADLHDRNLRIDDTVFFLGTSIKDAGTQPTNFSTADSTAAGHGVLDGIMGKGTAAS
jgi:hypothetical protein